MKKRQFLADAQDRMEQLMQTRLERSRHRLALMSGRLSGLSPLEKLSGGYGFVTDEKGKRLKSVDQVQEERSYFSISVRRESDSLCDGKAPGTALDGQ